MFERIICYVHIESLRSDEEAQIQMAESARDVLGMGDEMETALFHTQNTLNVRADIRTVRL